MLTIEKTAKTVEEALSEALRELNVDENQVEEQPAVPLDFIPHAFVTGIGKQQNADTGETDAGKIHRSEVIAESLFDKRVYDSPQYRCQYGV